MKKKVSVEQIVSVSKQAEVGVPIGELIRKVGISEQTFKSADPSEPSQVASPRYSRQAFLRLFRIFYPKVMTILANILIRLVS
jgi:hypothetical protein